MSAKLIDLKVSFAVSMCTLCNVHFELGNNLRLIIDIDLINLEKCVREDTWAIDYNQCLMLVCCHYQSRIYAAGETPRP
jgi:hypothetical protein